MNEDYLDHPKVKEAHRLLIEAWKETREKIAAETAKRKCRCRHVRRSHGPSHSINYTGGACGKCECLNYCEP